VLAGLLLAAACVLLGPAAHGSSVPVAAAAPCACLAAGPNANATGTVQDHVMEASAVFLGTVEAVTPPSTTGTSSARTSTVAVTTVYKGEMITTPTVDVVTTRSFANCTSELQLGEDYVFFVESDEGFTATGCGGTAVASEQLLTQVERLLGAGRPPVPPEPPTATFEPASTDEPASLTRVAAPGLALVLVGLLGLAVVRRLARPRP
jgi:hypothetical protein